MTISAIVPAAGCGARAALNGNKILAPLLGKPLLSWTLSALGARSQWEWKVAHIENWDLSAARTRSEIRRAELVEIVISAQRGEFAAIEAAVEGAQIGVAHRVVEGGATRQESVLNAVQAARGDFVLIHDAARPCLGPETLRKVVSQAESGAAIVALRVSDTVKLAAAWDADNLFPSVAETLDRNQIWLAQTPQVFRRDLFLEALQSAQNDGFQGTDCASLMERAGHRVALVAGDADNLKVTYAADLERAAAILSSRL